MKFYLKIESQIMSIVQKMIKLIIGIKYDNEILGYH